MLYTDDSVRAVANVISLLVLATWCCGGAHSVEETVVDDGPLGSGERPRGLENVDVMFDVDVGSERRPISPWIYGTNSDLSGVREQRWGIVRAGGNRSTAYNWENNASNAGSDWQFQNDGLVSAGAAPAAPLLEMIDKAASISAATIITISNADWVSADKNGGGDVRQSGNDYLRRRFKANHPRKGSAFSATPDASDGHVYQDELVAFLRRQRPSARILLSMDNEPDLWSYTHAEIFPTPVTYADLWRRNHAFARAAKDAWPEIPVLGFVSFGYSGYVDLQRASDARGRDFLDWYLQQARAAERAEGSRLIDYLDLHWYPEAQGGGERITGTGTGAAVVAAREQAPRSLWDPTYSEASWIRDKHGGPIDLLHWLQGKIARHYPGTKLAFTEWNYGAGNHISGALAVADVLGNFGKYGVGLACYWALIRDEHFANAAFRIYRNYDGQGASFGDISVRARSSDVEQSTIYASVHSDAPERAVIVLINKAITRKSAGIRIRPDGGRQRASVYRLTGDRPEVVRGGEILALTADVFRYDMPAQSISVIVPQP